jgi:hypothetical protein
MDIEDLKCEIAAGRSIEEATEMPELRLGREMGLG